MAVIKGDLLIQWDLAHCKEIFQYDTQRNGKLMLSQPEAIMIRVSPEISEDFVLTTGTGKDRDDQR